MNNDEEIRTVRSELRETRRALSVLRDAAKDRKMLRLLFGCIVSAIGLAGGAFIFVGGMALLAVDEWLKATALMAMLLPWLLVMARAANKISYGDSK